LTQDIIPLQETEPNKNEVDNAPKSTLVRGTPKLNKPPPPVVAIRMDELLGNKVSVTEENDAQQGANAPHQAADSENDQQIDNTIPHAQKSVNNIDTALFAKFVEQELKAQENFESDCDTIRRQREKDNQNLVEGDF